MLNVKVNTKGLADLTRKLKTVHKSAFPVAARKTANDLAFHMKQSSMPKEADQSFTNRQKTFFKANSKVIPAEGMNVSTMQAEMGFYENKLVNQSTNYAVKDLEQQEFGGVIKSKSLIPMKGARTGGNSTKLVKPNARIASLRNKKVVRAKAIAGATKKQAFIKAAFMAKKLYGNQAYVLGNRVNGGSRTLSIINQISSSKGKLTIRRTPLYSVKKGRVVTVRPRQFLKRAVQDTMTNVDTFYMKNAQLQFKKHGLLK